jgi:hypothetical protein
MFSTTTNDKDGSGGEQQKTVSGGMMERQMPQVQL